MNQKDNIEVGACTEFVCAAGDIKKTSFCVVFVIIYVFALTVVYLNDMSEMRKTSQFSYL